MTRTLSITATEWASVTDGRLWLVREGELHHGMDACDNWCSEVPPPNEFVQACAPCETCHEGRLWVQTAPDDMLDTGACPDCRINLVGPCDYWSSHSSPVGEWPCPKCEHRGTVALGYAYPVGEPLPIYGDGNPLRREPHLYVSKNGVVWVASEAGSVEATARLAHCGPPESLVGKWALQLEVSE